jgi:hypothetical protein
MARTSAAGDASRATALPHWWWEVVNVLYDTSGSGSGSSKARDGDGDGGGG